MPRIEPGATGWEARTLRLCYAPQKTLSQIKPTLLPKSLVSSPATGSSSARWSVRTATDRWRQRAAGSAGPGGKGWDIRARFGAAWCGRCCQDPEKSGSCCRKHVERGFRTDPWVILFLLNDSWWVSHVATGLVVGWLLPFYKIKLNN